MEEEKKINEIFLIDDISSESENEGSFFEENLIE